MSLKSTLWFIVVLFTATITTAYTTNVSPLIGALVLIAWCAYAVWQLRRANMPTAIILLIPVHFVFIILLSLLETLGLCFRCSRCGHLKWFEQEYVDKTSTLQTHSWCRYCATAESEEVYLKMLAKLEARRRTNNAPTTRE